MIIRNSLHGVYNFENVNERRRYRDLRNWTAEMSARPLRISVESAWYPTPKSEYCCVSSFPLSSVVVLATCSRREREKDRLWRSPPRILAPCCVTHAKYQSALYIRPFIECSQRTIYSWRYNTFHLYHNNSGRLLFVGFWRVLIYTLTWMPAKKRIKRKKRQPNAYATLI